eukprot:GHVR01023254.1.p1 GENE.GHVR01023254.1~~GHVR01023254.1.p1  ORF type:complete len:126 (+),score=10.93 GHVR01023254.1:325-702(+)
MFLTFSLMSARSPATAQTVLAVTNTNTHTLTHIPSHTHNALKNYIAIRKNYLLFMTCDGIITWYNNMSNYSEYYIDMSLYNLYYHNMSCYYCILLNMLLCILHYDNILIVLYIYSFSSYNYIYYI